MGIRAWVAGRMERSYLVRIEGRRIHSMIDGRAVVLGFATTRFLRASSGEAARVAALELVREQCREFTRIPPEPELSVIEIEELSPRYNGIKPVKGFTFFEDDDPDAAVQ